MRKTVKSVCLAVMMTLLALTLAACGKSEFGLTENTEKKMTITAENADPGDFFMTGALQEDEGEEIAVTANLSKGEVKVEIVRASDSEELPSLDGDAILTAVLSSVDSTSGTVPAGPYMLKATCTERATGTVVVEVRPAS